MRRIALSALISLRQARGLSIVQRGAHHAVVRGVLDRGDVDAIRRQAGQSVAVSTDGRASHVNCFDLRQLPDVLKRLQEAIGVVTEDRAWPPLAEDFQMCDAQHCVYSTGGHFDWHLDDESDGAQGFRRLSAVVLMSDSGEFEGGAFCVDRSEASALPLANCGDAVIFQGEHLWHRVGAVTAGRRETLVLGTFDRTRGASTASTGAPKRSGTALFATTGSSEETMRVPVVSKIRGLLPAVERELSAYALPPVELVESSGDDAAWADARIALADPGLVAGAPLDRAPSLEWLQSTWAGTNALMQGRRDFRCTKLSGCFGPLISEYVFAHLLGNSAGSRLLRSARGWAQEEFIEVARPLKGQTLGVLGTGDIGQHVAGVAKAFGMETLGLARDGAPRTNFDGTTADVDEILRQSDVVLSALPSTPATRGLLDGARLRACTRRPILINVGRGDLVSEASVVEALDEGWIAEASLDVFETEPLPAASPLWARDDCYVTPHVAALSRPDDVARVFAANLDRYLRGEPLLYEVDWGKGY